MSDVRCLKIYNWELRTTNKEQGTKNKEQKTNLCPSVKINLCVSVEEKYNPQIHTDAFHRYTQIALKEQGTKNKEPSNP